MTGEPTQPPTEDELADVIAEHMLNVLQALSSWAEGPTLLRLASKAVVALDQFAAEQARRPVVASPLHDSALLALDRLEAALGAMRVTDPVRVEGYTVAEQAGQMLTTLRKLVVHHEELAMHGNRPRIILPNGELAP